MVSKMRILWNGIKKIRKCVHLSQVDGQGGLTFLTYLHKRVDVGTTQPISKTKKSAELFNFNTRLVSR